MGGNTDKLEISKQQTITKSPVQTPAFSQIPQQSSHPDSLRESQLKAIKNLADAGPQSDKLRGFQQMASQQSTQKEDLQPKSDGKPLPIEADADGIKATGIGEKVLRDSPESGAPDKPTKLTVGEIKNNYDKGGFITEKASLRKTAVVNTIIASHKADKKSAAKIIQSGVLEKDKGWFGLGLLGAKTEKFALSDHFDPKKLGYLIPVKIDQGNEDKEIGWTPVQINYGFNAIAKQKLSVYKDEEGYVDAKKLIKSELDLNEKGAALTGKDNALGAAMNGSLVGKVAGFAVNNSSIVRGMANEAVGGALDLANKGADFIQKNALDKVEVFKGLSFQLDKEASKITPQGSFLTGKVSKNDWIFSATFKVNTQGDYSAEYMGAVIENPPDVMLESDNVSFKLNFGALVKHQASADNPSITSLDGNASFQLMGQEVFAKWNRLDFNLNEKKVTSADFSEVGLNVNLSVGETIKVEQLTAVVKDLAISDNILTYGDIALNIDAINLFDVAVFNNIKVNIGQKIGLTGEGDFDVTAPGLTGAKGKATIEKGLEDKVAKYTLQNGEFSATILGQPVSFNGVNYDSMQPNEISAASGSLQLNFSFGDILRVDAFDATVTNAKLTQDNGFTYDNIAVNIASVGVLNDVAQFSNITGNISAEEGFNATGDFLVTAPDLANASGKVSVQRAPDALSTQYKLENGAFTATILGQEVSVSGVTYDSENPHEILAASSNIKLNFSAGSALTVEDFDATMTDAKVTAGGFSYQDIRVNIASINVMDVAIFSAINGKVSADGGLDGSGLFNVSLPGLGGGNGIVTVTKGPGDKITRYLMEDGAFTAEMVGQTAMVSGVSYDSATNIFSVEEGKLDLKIWDADLQIVILNPSFSKSNGFDFASATANIPELSFADKAKMTNIVVSIVKDGDKYSYSGSSDFNLSGEINGASASASGSVSLTNEAGDVPGLSFTNGNVVLIIYDQRLELNNVQYKTGEFEAEKAVVNISPPFMKKRLLFTVNNLKINEKGYSFSKSTLETQLEVDFGIIKGNLAGLALEKTNENWIISGEGGLAAGGTSFFGYNIPKIEGSGSLSYDVGKKEIKKELTGVSATLPDIEFPGSFFPGTIGGSADIPVFPGLNVVASAGMEGKVNVPGLQLSIDKGEQAYLISAGTQKGKPASGEVKVFVSLGIGTGIPLIATVSLSIGAEGGVSVTLDFSASKEIASNENVEGLNLDSKSMETSYTLAGDLSLAAFLELKATAFYFFNKSFKKNLLKRNFGGFEVSDQEQFKWIAPSESLQSEEEITSNIKNDLKINLLSFEEKVWTKDAFVKASSGVFRGDRKRVLVVDRALATFDKVRGESFSAEIKVEALKKLESEILGYLERTKGTSSRTNEVQQLYNQIKEVIKSLRAKLDKNLVNV